MHKNLKPLKEFICDVCGEVIKDIDDGYVVWRSDRDHDSLQYDFKIIHQGDCDDESSKRGCELEDFLEIDGLNSLLGDLSMGVLKVNTGSDSYKEQVSVKSTDEFVDLIRRLQIPNYEEARQFFCNNNVIDKYQDGHETAPYSQEIIKNILKNS